MSTNLQSAPIVCLCLAALALILSFQLSSDYEVVGKNDLQSYAGSVDRAFRSTWHSGGRYGGGSVPMVNVIVQGSDGSSYQMVQDERVNGASGIVSLVPGENVTALMQQRGSKLPLLWELNRDGSTILSYDDTRQFFQSKLHRASWARAIAFLLFVVSIVLRIRFGAWRGNKEEPDY